MLKELMFVSCRWRCPNTTKRYTRMNLRTSARLFLLFISGSSSLLILSNRIDEASTLWDSVSNSRWFAQSSLVLFLNKTDLFREKLKVSPLAHYMPQYQGDGDWQSASQFMLGHFTALLKNPNKRLYSHFTCATVSAAYCAYLRKGSVC